MKIVYVMASDGRDSFTSMARISMTSLRLTHPDVRVEVVCDTHSNRAIRAAHDPVLDEVDEWWVFETPPGDGSFRSKYLKSSLRQRVSGIFLYLDVDTIVRGDLSALFAMNGDIAGAPNHSREQFARQVWQGDQAILSAMGWSTRDTFYVNSGVLLAFETEGARRVYQMWHDKWQMQQSRLHDSRDQPSLNTAIRETDVDCRRMECRYNAQIGANPLAMRAAAIWHYYYSLSCQSQSYVGDLIQKTLETQKVDVERLRELMQTQILWPKAYWISGPGVHMVNGAVRDLALAVAAGQGADELLHSLDQTDPVFARQVLAKAAVDGYWSSQRGPFRFAMRNLVRRYPGDVFRAPVRRCLVHDMYRRLKRVCPGNRA